MSQQQSNEGEGMMDKTKEYMQGAKEKMGEVGEGIKEQGQKASDTIQQKSHEGMEKMLSEVPGTDQTAKETTLETENADHTAANISIFDDKEFSTTDECVQYMTETFGFFIPDVERLMDLEGLLVYLGEKVKLGGYCLYCQEVFAPGKPCQDHMVNASHCKLRYEVGVDREEYEDFYEYEVSADDGAVEDNMDAATISKLAPDDDRVQDDVDVQQRKPVLDPLRKELLRLGSKFGDLNFSAEELVRMED